jgi:hypothetical protein
VAIAGGPPARLRAVGDIFQVSLAAPAWLGEVVTWASSWALPPTQLPLDFTHFTRPESPSGSRPVYILLASTLSTLECIYPIEVSSAPHSSRKPEQISQRYKLTCCRLLRFSRELARRVFPLLFPITLIFLHSTCTTLSTSRTQREPSIPTALKSHRPVLSPNIEIF